MTAEGEGNLAYRWYKDQPAYLYSRSILANSVDRLCRLVTGRTTNMPSEALVSKTVVGNPFLEWSKQLTKVSAYVEHELVRRRPENLAHLREPEFASLPYPTECMDCIVTTVLSWGHSQSERREREQDKYEYRLQDGYPRGSCPEGYKMSTSEYTLGLDNNTTFFLGANDKDGHATVLVTLRPIKKAPDSGQPTGHISYSKSMVDWGYSYLDTKVWDRYFRSNLGARWSIRELARALVARDPLLVHWLYPWGDNYTGVPFFLINHFDRENTDYSTVFQDALQWLLNHSDTNRAGMVSIMNQGYDSVRNWLETSRYRWYVRNPRDERSGGRPHNPATDAPASAPRGRGQSPGQPQTSQSPQLSPRGESTEPIIRPRVFRVQSEQTTTGQTFYGAFKRAMSANLLEKVKAAERAETPTPRRWSGKKQGDQGVQQPRVTSRSPAPTRSVGAPAPPATAPPLVLLPEPPQGPVTVAFESVQVGAARLRISEGYYAELVNNHAEFGEAHPMSMLTAPISREDVPHTVSEMQSDGQTVPAENPPVDPEVVARSNVYRFFREPDEIRRNHWMREIYRARCLNMGIDPEFDRVFLAGTGELNDVNRITAQHARAAIDNMDLVDAGDFMDALEGRSLGSASASELFNRNWVLTQSTGSESDVPVVGNTWRATPEQPQ